VKYN